MQDERAWYVVATLADEEIDQASFYCNRAVRVLRSNSRAIGSDGEVVYEAFYNDPDAIKEDNIKIRWQQAGF